MQTDEDISKYYHFYDKKLGEGGFAKVTLATHIATRQNVAIKCLDKVKLGPELPRIYNEIECLKRLKHKNIARLYQVFETQTIIYLVLEYCPGGELFDYIVKKSKLSEPESAQILFDLMRVLDFIHMNGFAHRDLKPENLLFDDKHQIKLIDFGLAANCSAEHLAVNTKQAPIDQLNTCCGSVTYAAPEVISGSVYSGTAVDVWSAGVMMYALLVGQLPFNDNSISKLYQKIQGGIKNLPTFLSPEACDLIRKMLTVDPKQRITVRDVLSHPWLRNRTINQTRINRRLDFRSGQLDEQIVKRCCERFPELSETQLRQYIQQDFNYYSTAYHLLLAKCPPRSFGVKRTPDRVAPCSIVVASPRVNNNTNQFSNNNNTIYSSDQKPKIVYNVSPVKKTRFVTVTNTPKTPRTPPSYLRRLQEIKTNSPATGTNNRITTINALAITPSKLRVPNKNVFTADKKPSVVRRLLGASQNATYHQIVDATTAPMAMTPYKFRPVPQQIARDEQENTNSENKRIYDTFGTAPRKKSVVKRLIGSATPSKLKKFYCRNR